MVRGYHKTYNLRGRGQPVLVSLGIPLRHCVSLYDLGRGVLKRMSVLDTTSVLLDRNKHQECYYTVTLTHMGLSKQKSYP